MSRGTIILFELEELVFRIISLESEYIFNIGAAERINALGIIANHAKIPQRFSQEFDNIILCFVSVLELINKYIFERMSVPFKDLRKMRYKQEKIKDYVIEIHCGRTEQFFLISLVYSIYFRSVGGFVMFNGFRHLSIFIGRYEARLGS